MHPYHEHHIVRLRRRMMTTRYMHKRVYKYPRYEPSIPASYRDLLEEFFNNFLLTSPKTYAAVTEVAVDAYAKNSNNHTCRAAGRRRH